MDPRFLPPLSRALRLHGLPWHGPMTPDRYAARQRRELRCAVASALVAFILIYALTRTP